MDPIQQKRTPISRAEASLLRRAAMIGYWWYSKGNGKDSTGNGWQTLVEVAATFGLPHRTPTDMVKKAKWRARKAIGDKENKPNPGVT